MESGHQPLPRSSYASSTIGPALRDSAPRLSTVAPLSGLISSRQQREPITGRGALVSVMGHGLTITRLPVPLLLTAAN